MENKDDAIRASWLDSKNISVVKIKEGLWKIIFNYPCIQLEEKDGKYCCKKYNSMRPDYCKTFPNNFKGEEKEVIDEIKKVCSLVK